MFNIPFLEWAKIDKEALDIMGFDWIDSDVLISPDVNSLHIVWSYADAIFHEIADYPHPYQNKLDFLMDEIGGDSWEIFEGETDVYTVVNSGEITPIDSTSIRTITIKDIDPK